MASRDKAYHFVRPQEAARRLCVSPRTLYRMEKRGEIPKRERIGGRVVAGWRPEIIEPFFLDRPDRLGRTDRKVTS